MEQQLQSDTLFLMSNLEGFGIFIHIFVGNRHLGSVKVLFQVIQFPHQRIVFFCCRLICFLQGFLFGIQRIVIAAQLFHIEVSGVDSEAQVVHIGWEKVSELS